MVQAVCICNPTGEWSPNDEGTRGFGGYVPLPSWQQNGRPVYQLWVVSRGVRVYLSRLLYYAAGGWQITTPEAMALYLDHLDCLRCLLRFFSRDLARLIIRYVGVADLNMAARCEECWWKVEDEALLPQDITTPWRGWDVVHKEWAVTSCTIGLDPGLDRAYVEAQAALASLAEAKPLVVEYGEVSGRYAPVETRHGRALWRSLDVAGAEISYSNGYWNLGREKMPTLKSTGYTDALVPPLSGWLPLRELTPEELGAEQAARAMRAEKAGDDVKLFSPSPWFEGIACMGWYFRVGKFDDAPRMHNGRAVYYHGVGEVAGWPVTSSSGKMPRRYLFYSLTLQWVVGNLDVLTQDLDDNVQRVGYYGAERDCVGWLRVRSNAIDPAEITEEWQALAHHDIVAGRPRWTSVRISVRT